jgi:hypothetical protein
MGVKKIWQDCYGNGRGRNDEDWGPPALAAIIVSWVNDI